MAGVKVTVDVTGLEQLVERLRLMAAEIEPKITEAILANAERTAEVASANASSHSKKIPPTIKAIELGIGAVISAGNDSTPLAALMERGSLHKPDPSGWRHPVYARGPRSRWAWAKKPQSTHPYLRPAVTETLDENLGRLVVALTDLARETIGEELPA